MTTSCARVILVVLSLGMGAPSLAVADKATGGGIIGAIAGGLIGNRVSHNKFVGTAAGVVIGGLVGHAIGGYLDEADNYEIERCEQRAFRASRGKRVTWQNRDSGAYGTMVWQEEGRSRSSGQPCRRYNHSIYVSGESDRVAFHACLNQDDRWERVDERYEDDIEYGSHKPSDENSYDDFDDSTLDLGDDGSAGDLE